MIEMTTPPLTAPCARLPGPPAQLVSNARFPADSESGVEGTGFFSCGAAGVFPVCARTPPVRTTTATKTRIVPRDSRGCALISVESPLLLCAGAPPPAPASAHPRFAPVDPPTCRLVGHLQCRSLLTLRWGPTPSAARSPSVRADRSADLPLSGAFGVCYF